MESSVNIGLDNSCTKHGDIVFLPRWFTWLCVRASRNGHWLAENPNNTASVSTATCTVIQRSRKPAKNTAFDVFVGSVAFCPFPSSCVQRRRQGCIPLLVVGCPGNRVVLPRKHLVPKRWQEGGCLCGQLNWDSAIDLTTSSSYFF